LLSLSFSPFSSSNPKYDKKPPSQQYQWLKYSTEETSNRMSIYVIERNERPMEDNILIAGGITPDRTDIIRFLFSNPFQ
jgi:hypothetical protein